MRIIAATKYDILFQFRHGFYYAYLLVGALYVLFLRSIPVSFQEAALTLVIFTDPSVLGFFFIGGIVLMEKTQRTLESLFVTPLRLEEYFISKVASLTLLSTAVSLGIVLLVYGIPNNPLTFLVGIILSSVLFTLIGLIASAWTKDLNEYILTSLIYMPVIFLPLLDYLELTKSPIFYLFPTKASLMLIESAFIPISLGQSAYAVTNLALWSVIAYIWAKRWFEKYIILGIGENK